MAELIWETEGKLPTRHLIANNAHAVPHMAIFNAHYDCDCSFARTNYGGTSSSATTRRDSTVPATCPTGGKGGTSS